MPKDFPKHSLFIFSPVRHAGCHGDNGQEEKDSVAADTTVAKKEVAKACLLYTSYSYQNCLETQIGLGLDLKGGMNVILEISGTGRYRIGDSGDRVCGEA